MIAVGLFIVAALLAVRDVLIGLVGQRATSRRNWDLVDQAQQINLIVMYGFFLAGLIAAVVAVIP